MMALKRLAESGTHHVCIDLSRADIGVSQHGLYTSQIGPSLEEVRSECVP
jgi:hypothetical protein